MNRTISIIAVLALTCTVPAFASNAKSASAATQNKSADVTFDGVVLLTPESELQGNIEVPDLVKLISNTEFLVRGIFAASPRPATLVLHFDCSPTEQKVSMALRGDPELQRMPQITELMRQLDEYAAQLEHLKVKANSVSFRLQFSIVP